VKPPISRGYAAIRRTWQAGDTVELSLPMPVERLAAHPDVLHARGKVALRRGPLVYAFEQADNSVPLRQVTLPGDAAFETPFDGALAGGVVRITTSGLVREAADWERRLYQPLGARDGKTVELSAVPYAIWGNRGAGEMIVWIDESK
jgi:hypothetical protein